MPRTTRIDMPGQVAKIGGDDIANSVVDMGITNASMAVDLLGPDGKPRPVSITGAQLASALGVQSMAMANLDSIKMVRTSNTSSNGHIAVAFKQVNESGKDHEPLPTFGRHIKVSPGKTADKNGVFPSSIVAAHLHVPPGEHKVDLVHEFHESASSGTAAPFKKPGDESTATQIRRGMSWNDEFGKSAKDLLSGCITVSMDGETDRTAIPFSDSGLGKLAQKNSNNPEAIQALFAGAHHSPVEITHPTTGEPTTCIIAPSTSVKAAAEDLSKQIGHPFLNNGLVIKPSTVSGSFKPGDSAIAHIEFIRSPLGGEDYSGPLSVSHDLVKDHVPPQSASNPLLAQKDRQQKAVDAIYGVKLGVPSAASAAGAASASAAVAIHDNEGSDDM